MFGKPNIVTVGNPKEIETSEVLKNLLTPRDHSSPEVTKYLKEISQEESLNSSFGPEILKQQQAPKQNVVKLVKKIDS